MGWAGLKNGELLKAAEGGGIDVLLTGDQTLKGVALLDFSISWRASLVDSAIWAA